MNKRTFNVMFDASPLSNDGKYHYYVEAENAVEAVSVAWQNHTGNDAIRGISVKEVSAKIVR